MSLDRNYYFFVKNRDLNKFFQMHSGGGYDNVGRLLNNKKSGLIWKTEEELNLIKEKEKQYVEEFPNEQIFEFIDEGWVYVQDLLENIKTHNLLGEQTEIYLENEYSIHDIDLRDFLNHCHLYSQLPKEDVKLYLTLTN